MKAISFSEAAEQEYADAIKYYRESSIKSSRKYVIEMKKIVKRIQRFSHTGIQIAPGIRKGVLKVFPYSIIYRIYQNKIEIIAVAHQSRHPDYWKERIP